MVYCTALERRHTERYLEFESHRLRYNRSMKYLLAIIVILVLGWGSVLVFPEATSDRYELADTREERSQGLSFRTEIPKEGMLFIFREKAIQGFWMKDMLISIDIVWLSDEGVIVGIEENISPDSYPEVFYSPEPVRYVLEIKGGGAKERGWEIGDTVPLR